MTGGTDATCRAARNVPRLFHEAGSERRASLPTNTTLPNATTYRSPFWLSPVFRDDPDASGRTMPRRIRNYLRTMGGSVGALKNPLALIAHLDSLLCACRAAGDLDVLISHSLRERLEPAPENSGKMLRAKKCDQCAGVRFPKIEGGRRPGGHTSSTRFSDELHKGLYALGPVPAKISLAR